MTPISFMDIEQVMQATRKSKSTIYDWIRKGSFPKPVPLGEHSVGWETGEYNAWARSRIELRLASLG